jgi:hypothetical protein
MLSCFRAGPHELPLGNLRLGNTFASSAVNSSSVVANWRGLLMAPNHTFSAQNLRAVFTPPGPTMFLNEVVPIARAATRRCIA